jgi:small subunit ribosomal protein S17
MADEVETNELQETAAADAAAVASAADASAETATSGTADESAAEEAPDAEATADATPEAAPEPAEPQVQLTPKERRQVLRDRRVARAGERPAQTPEERQAERDALRVKKAAARRTSRAKARAKYKASEHERSETPAREHVAGNQKTRQGIVVSDKADKTITVRIDVARRHRRYSKIVRTSMTLHAHDESNDAGIGDTVVVRESRPLSRTKRWRLVQVVEKAK